MALFSRQVILDALMALSEEIGSGAPALELVLVGEAAIVILYHTRDSTKDVDAFVLGEAGEAVVREAAGRVAARLGLPEDWLNVGAKDSVHVIRLGGEILRTPALIVSTLAPEHLLAIKLSAWRDDVDFEDGRLLLSRVAGDRDSVWQAIEPLLVPGRGLKARYAFDDLCDTERRD